MSVVSKRCDESKLRARRNGDVARAFFNNVSDEGSIG